VVSARNFDGITASVEESIFVLKVALGEGIYGLKVSKLLSSRIMNNE
jgi:hypothetical protein